ncbi:MAG: hypothetical protein Kow006_32810 [Gammaproteobacteria bacterium]
MNRTARQGIVAVALLFLSGAAIAQGFYFGASYGPSEVDVSGYDESESLRLFLGSEVSQNLALEVAFVDLGTFDVTGTSASVDAWGLDLSVLGKLPVSNSFSLYGKFGLFSWDVEGTIPGLLIATDSGSDITYGVGADFDFGNHWHGRIAWDFYPDVSGGDIDAITFGASYQF